MSSRPEAWWRVIAASLWVVSLICFLSALAGITALYYQPHHGMDEAGKHLRWQTYGWLSGGLLIQAIVIAALTRSFHWKNRLRSILGPVAIVTTADVVVLVLMFVFVRYIA